MPNGQQTRKEIHDLLSKHLTTEDTNKVFGLINELFEITQLSLEVTVNDPGNENTRDTIEGRMVEARLEALKKEFGRNDIPVNIVWKFSSSYREA